MSVSHSARSEADCPFVCFYEEVKHDKDLATLLQRLNGQVLREIGQSLVILRRAFCHLYFAKRFDNWVRD